MKALQRSEKEQIGFSFVVEQLLPLTPYGKDRLKNLVPYTREQIDELKREFEIQEAILLHKEELIALQKKIKPTFMGVKEVRGSIKKSLNGVLTEVDFFELKSLCIILEKLMPYVERYAAITGIHEWKMRPLDALLQMLDPEGERIPSFYISHLYMPQLQDIREEKRQVEIRLREATGEKKEEEKERLLKERDRIVDKEEACNRQVLERLTSEFCQYHGDLIYNINVLGHMDYVWQKIDFYEKYNCIRPIVGADGFSVKEMVHPAVCHVLREKGTEFTPLSMEITPGVCVITGANMGGKSVTIKTAALITYMAYNGFFVPAKTCELPIYDEIFLIMDEYEETSRGLSSFGGEIIRMRDCLEQMGERRCLVLMDEPARGTNPEEGARIVQALVRYLKKTNSDTFVATHYEHIAELADNHYQVYGLKHYTDEDLEAAVLGLTNKDRVRILAKYMDYGVYKVEKAEPLPQDAIRVCRLLGLQEEILREL